MLDVTFITYSGLPSGDDDDLLALDILRGRGHRCAVIDWRAGFDAHQTRLAVLRSTWDYHMHLANFRDFVAATAGATTLLNPRDLVISNLDKKYLLELEIAGIEITPTMICETLPDIDLLFDFARDHAASSLIVKPSVGLSTHGVERFDLDRISENPTELLSHAGELLESSAVVVQPYLSAVQESGERALVFIDGVYSHSIRKSPFQKLARAGHAGETALPASEEQIAFARRVIDTLPVTPLYARVDLVESNEKILLLELELTEPSLYLHMSPGAAERFADAIERRLIKA